MKGYAMLKIGEAGWIEKDTPACGPLDAICRPLAVAICTSDVHTVWEGAVGERHDMILGHECCAEVVEVGADVKDFKPGDRVLVPAITPDWNSLEAQAGYAMHSGGMLAGWKFSNFKDGVFAEYFHVNDADGNLAHLPKEINVVDACMLSDMVPTGFHGVELADVQFGDVVLVIGIGPVGLMAVAGTNMRGAARIIAGIRRRGRLGRSRLRLGLLRLGRRLRPGRGRRGGRGPPARSGGRVLRPGGRSLRGSGGRSARLRRRGRRGRSGLRRRRR